MVRGKTRVSLADYYSRQVRLREFGSRGQRRLSRSRVAVVGMGGLGTVSSLYLALAGVGHLRVLDQDTVEVPNLHRQILYTPGDVGYPKVEVAARRLMDTNPLVEVEAVPENVNAGNVEELLSGVDCVVDGLDNLRTRYLVNRACIRLGVPYVFGAAIGVEGNLSVFEAPETPCLECVLSGVDDNYLETCEVRGIIGATAGIIGTLQAMETIKVLSGMGSALRGRLMICDFSDMYFTTLDVFKREGCPACQPSAKPRVGKERLVWLCGRNTANINPESPLRMGLDEAYELVKKDFRVRLRSRLAVIFDCDGFEVTLFNGGRMLIKNVGSERVALDVYRRVRRKLGDG